MTSSYHRPRTKAELLKHLQDEHGLNRAGFYARDSYDVRHMMAHKSIDGLQAAHTPRELTCAECGATFVGRGRAKYCKRACQVRAYYWRKKARHPQKEKAS